MKRFDLRHLKNDFYGRMLELMDKQIKDGENAIIIFEIGDFENIQKSADVIYEAGYTLMNSIKFTEVDWTLVIKKVAPEPRVVEEEAAKEEVK
ncbi:NADH-ubiquinone oxidoreductase subunit E family protein [Poseidonibacter lekithochrous]|uniref:NADH-ubiquinone oxidoreductase subunit E family protein n=1 Tax=Poseidonibacter TaxID=2321187 RepID=UPI001C08A735|nr:MULTISPECIES: NADH-ubiquinone oxidoreductase subunit E family protein [Poseidonibacter]MBU3014675.1 NADH-ubiquinone oxidoreductase subunit E family protein [Poseidonibacter lekithochrous]MDO6827973.1 NADH-ubiquinone oxidoreductase subunit E family protein [Poseidonibacter sp. 1_MG-2023]